MENPYEASRAELPAASVEPGVGALLLRLLILVLSSLQCLVLTYYLAHDPLRFFGIGQADLLWSLGMLFSYLSSLLLLIGGALLLFSRRAARWCFLGYLPHQLWQTAWVQRGDQLGFAILSLLLVLGFIVYTHTLDRRGQLR